MPREKKKGYLRSPFADAQAAFARIAAEAGFEDGEPGSPLSFKQILGGAQEQANSRAAALAVRPDWKENLDDLSLGSFPNEMLSYLGTVPREDLLPTQRARIEQLRGFIKGGEISAELDRSRPHYKRLQRCQWDLADLIKGLGSRLDGKDVSTEGLLDHFEAWAEVIAGVVVEFIPKQAPPRKGKN